jgi:hypothetical protein
MPALYCKSPSKKPPKLMKKIFKKKIISDLLTLIFSRYETGTTGFFFTPDTLGLVDIYQVLDALHCGLT